MILSSDFSIHFCTSGSDISGKYRGSTQRRLFFSKVQFYGYQRGQFTLKVNNLNTNKYMYAFLKTLDIFLKEVSLRLK